MELLKNIYNMQLIRKGLPKWYQVVMNKTLALRNIMLKYTISKDKRLIPRSYGITSEIKNLEKEIFGEVICSLESKIS